MSNTGFDAFRFGVAGRQLFGLYQPASAGVDRRHAVLLCPPFGQEAIRAQRMFRVLAERLSRDGFHVMRFDYLGTGDADGDDDVCSLDDWTRDVQQAAAELTRRSGAARCSWLGLRLGASLAALASAQAISPPDKLILWDPVLEGAPYLAELAQAHHAELKFLHDTAWPAPKHAADTPLKEALGFPISEALRSQLLALSPSDLARLHACAVVAVISGTASPSLQTLARELVAKSVPYTSKPVGESIVWASGDAMNTALVPMEALKAMLDALKDDA